MFVRYRRISLRPTFMARYGASNFSIGALADSFQARPFC